MVYVIYDILFVHIILIVFVLFISLSVIGTAHVRLISIHMFYTITIHFINAASIKESHNKSTKGL